MSSGNPFGLSEISHFGSFQRVGGKAGGFINKKFFHPSNLRNQEKLWKAQTEDERQRRKEIELEKRRQEERQVEELKKQMYLAGQGKAGDFLSSSAAEDDSAKMLSNSEKREQKDAFDEQKRRKALLRKEHAQREAALASPEDDDEEDDDDDDRPEDVSRTLAKSKYQEDVFVQGHTSVWGSWYSLDDKQWGFGCCKVMKRETECPLAPEEEVPETKKEPRGRKRRRRGGAAAAGDREPVGDESHLAVAASNAAGGSSGSSGSSSGVAAPEAGSAVACGSTGRGSSKAESLLDTRMLEAAERRKQEAQLKAERKEASAKPIFSGSSEYLKNLLQDPSSSERG